MLKQDPYPGRQLRSLIAAALLSPVTRQIPGSAAALGGRAAWAAPLAALPALLFYAWLLSRLRQELEPGEALPEYALRRLGRRGGRAALLALAAWLLVLAGFTLRFGAERLQVSSYPRSGPALFVVCLGIPALLAALGPFRSLLRLGRMILPVLLTALGLILFSAFRSLELTELLPLGPADAPDLLRGALPSLNLLSFALSALCLFPAGRKAGAFRQGHRAGNRAAAPGHRRPGGRGICPGQDQYFQSHHLLRHDRGFAGPGVHDPAPDPEGGSDQCLKRRWLWLWPCASWAPCAPPLPPW